MFYNWSNIEIGVGFLACNLTTLSPHWARKVPEWVAGGLRSTWDSTKRLFPQNQLGTSVAQMAQPEHSIPSGGHIEPGAMQQWSKQTCSLVVQRA